MRRNVDLPEPLWPMSATSWPAGTARSSGSRAVSSPYALLARSATRIASAIGLAPVRRREGAFHLALPPLTDALPEAHPAAHEDEEHAPRPRPRRWPPPTRGCRRAPRRERRGSAGSRGWRCPGGHAVRNIRRMPWASGGAIDQVSLKPAEPPSTLTSAPAGAAEGQRARRARRRCRSGTWPEPGSAATPAAMAAVHTITVMLTGTWRRWMWPFSKGEASRRVGWSTSWARGSIPSSPAMNMARPATTTSGVVPDQAPRRAAPATTASRARRAMRAAGQRSTPWKPRTTIGARPVPWTRIRIHGRRRGSSRASWRRRSTTVRRSCSVAAKRSWPTSVERRSAASSDVAPTTVSPTSTRASATTRGDQPQRVELERPQQQAAVGLGDADVHDVGAGQAGRCRPARGRRARRPSGAGAGRRPPGRRRCSGRRR